MNVDRLTDEHVARLRETFNDDALRRLVNSGQDYYRAHGDYVPPLAAYLLHERAALREREQQLREAREALHRIADGDTHTAAWMQKVACAALGEGAK